jgi:APA family basic amino acid/polyamine antiporter
MHPVRVNASSGGRLLRVFGVAFALAIAIGGTVGAGIMRTPGDIAALLPSVPLILAVWVFGGVNALLGTTAYCELGTMMPSAGGPYVYVRRALGDFAGFFVGYVNWMQECAVMSALALLIAEYSGALFPWVGSHVAAAAVAVVMLLVLLQWFRVRWGGAVQSVTTVAKVLGLGALVIAAFIFPAAGAAGGAPPPAALPQGLALLAALALAMQGVIFTYNGYQYPVYFGEELRDPGREIPRAMLQGLALIIAIYLLLNVAFLRVLPLGQLAHDPFAGATVAHKVFGVHGDQLLRVIIIVSLVSVVNTAILAGPRILLAMARDQLFAHQATRVNAGGTPTVATLLTTLVALVFLLSGTFSTVLSLAAALMVVQYVLVFVAVFVLRRREPHTPRPYRAWGHPWTTGTGFVLGVLFLAGVVFGDPAHSAIAFGVLAVSYPLFRLLRPPRVPATSV